MEWIADPQAWIGLLTLTVLEIVLGIDNIIFISILSSTLPRESQARARRLGLTWTSVAISSASEATRQSIASIIARFGRD